MRIVATSDMHGRLPDPRTIPECDVVVLAGDIAPLEYDAEHWRALDWFDTTFRGWLDSLPTQHILAIAGNHDFCICDNFPLVKDLKLPWTYLQDDGVTIDDVAFWGTPWVPNLRGWAFYGDNFRLEQVFQTVPEFTDVVISHSPPKGHLDNEIRLFGASQVNDMLKRVKPKVFICGHIHEAYGRQLGYKKHTDLYNVSHCNMNYEGVNPPVVIHV